MEIETGIWKLKQGYGFKQKQIYEFKLGVALSTYGLAISKEAERSSIMPQLWSQVNSTKFRVKRILILLRRYKHVMVR